MMEINLSNLLFGGFVIEAIDFLQLQPSQAVFWKIDLEAKHTHAHSWECEVEFINEPELVASQTYGR